MISLLPLLLISAAQAAIPGKRLLDVEVRIGTRESHYVVSESARRELNLTFVNNDRANRRTQIKPGEFKELKKIVRQMAAKSHDLRLCPQQYIKVTSGNGATLLACENAQNPLGEKMRRFVTLLRFLI